MHWRDWFCQSLASRMCIWPVLGNSTVQRPPQRPYDGLTLIRDLQVSPHGAQLLPLASNLFEARQVPQESPIARSKQAV